ncbi:hypothetical protein [Actinomyces faecalis]|uniref:hypothetical protein n=1 Tax=Actinomyces faecalis TaxID=2722820 RepID=UPI00155773CE|nr:hypothetical protein [Actinomyces faecalis]
MPATTTRMKIPYPLPGDRLADYPTTAQQAAARLEAALTPARTTLTLETGWQADTSSGPLSSIGVLHTTPICVKWPRSDFRVTTSDSFPIYRIPTGIPTPPDWTCLGFIHNGAYVMPLVYRSADRSIRVQPTSSFTWGTGWCYGTATWIA